MRIRLLSASALVAAAISLLPAQYKMLEQVKPVTGQVLIPYTKYVLDNGLTVILHEDHSDPLVHVDVTYHVGSAREELQKSGFAHFFEHMMFQGSKHVRDEEHFQIVTEAGGQLNGTTNRDRTNYFETVPSNYLETALWLEADRMGFLLDSVTQRKFEVQRETVKNERGQNYDNVPYGLVFEHISQSAYPEGFPYSWLTIGYIEDLNRVGVEELRKFFLRWYGPNNAVLTIGGDIDPAQTMALVVKYFGSIPRGPEVQAMAPLDVAQWQATYTEDRYLVLEDKVRQPQLDMSWPGVQLFHKDQYALDCMTDILGGGKASRLHAKLVKTQKARSASAYSNASELAGNVAISVRAYPDQSLAEMERLVREVIDEFAANGPTEEEIASYKARMEASIINSLASVSSRCSRLASNQTFRNNPNGVPMMLAEIKAVTREDVMRVFETYVKGKHCLIHSTVPKGSRSLAAKDEDWKGSRGKWTGPKEDYNSLQLRPVSDNFDRSQRPVPGPAAPVTVPAFWTKTMKNKATVIGAQSTELPVVSINVTFKGRYEYLLAHPEHAGIFSLAADLLNEGNAKYTSEQMTMELDKLGSAVSFSADGNGISFNIRCLSTRLDATLALAALRFGNRQLSADDFDRLRRRALENVKEDKNDPVEIARLVYSKLLYGETHPQGLPAGGTEQTLSSLTLDNIGQMLDYMLRPEHAHMVVVGDVDKKTVLKKCTFLTQMTAKPYTGIAPGGSLASKPLPVPAIEKTRIYLVNKEGAPQSQIWAGMPGIPYDATGTYYKAGLMNYTLGGMFNSRLNLTLREKRGFTYGARSSFSGTLYPGTWTFSTGVKTPATDSAVVDFLNEVNMYRNQGISPKELQFVKLSYNQRDALSYETPWQRAGFLLPIIWYGLPKDFVDQQRTILNNLSAEDVKALSNQLIQPDKLNILVVGDKKTILPGLKKLGLEIWELDVDGKVISKQVQ